MKRQTPKRKEKKARPLFFSYPARMSESLSVSRCPHLNSFDLFPSFITRPFSLSIPRPPYFLIHSDDVHAQAPPCQGNCRPFWLNPCLPSPTPSPPLHRPSSRERGRRGRAEREGALLLFSPRVISQNLDSAAT